MRSTLYKHSGNHMPGSHPGTLRTTGPSDLPATWRCQWKPADDANRGPAGDANRGPAGDAGNGCQTAPARASGGAGQGVTGSTRPTTLR